MKHAVTHDLDHETARRVTEHAFSSYKDRFTEYKPTMQWVSDRRADVGFTVKGMSLKGAFELSPGEIGLELDVPLLLRPFKGVAIKVIEDEIRKWVGKAKAGEL